MGFKLLNFLFIFSLLMPGLFQAKALSYPGYLSDVKTEREEHFYEIYLFMDPPPVQQRLQDVIFNPELSKEFKFKYQEKFGQIDTESIAYQKSNYSVLDLYRSGDNPLVKQNGERRAYAEFMMKRLTEWHVDHYFKSEPNLRAVVEAKERLSKVQVAVSKDSRLDLNYSFAGNTLDLNYINPYMDSKLTVMMDPSSFGPAEVQENWLQLGKNIRKDLRLNTNVWDKDGIASVEIIKSLKWNWATSIAESSYFRDSGKSIRESRTSLGLSHSY